MELHIALDTYFLSISHGSTDYSAWMEKLVLCSMMFRLVVPALCVSVCSFVKLVVSGRANCVCSGVLSVLVGRKVVS